ncbi:hypothetical protein E7T09_04190 [Deinococcus sp. KSM4-11]|uniref:hypothetical protein n=1 Tax=Deinococcus sp. KSM4-11 TaxID=2568654 RepID=UPI0010A36FAF|nr:hypothetical protein [Deinococcus sp. KSM4-11]THF88413.1 hypothetical protein E7T09_04190 [Deinococcus sp. KSM4-11]
MADLYTHLMTLRRQREARDVTSHELALLDDLADELTRLQIKTVIEEGEANNLRPGLPILRQGVEALRDELRAELKMITPGARANPVEVINRISARLDGLL